MKEKSLAYARYWRNSLADSDLGRGRLSGKEEKNFLRLDSKALASGHAGQEIINQCFSKESESVKSVAVLLRPKVYCAQSMHGKKRRNGVPEIVTPLVTQALLARDGKLYPLSGTVVPRDLIEPLEHGFYAIGRLSDLDKFLSTDGVPGIEYVANTEDSVRSEKFEEQWQKYQAGCKRLLAQVCWGWPLESDGLEAASYGYLISKVSNIGFSRHIRELYDHLGKYTPSVPLFNCYAREEVSPDEEKLPANDAFSQRLGHSSNTYSLAVAQRDALIHLLKSRNGEILAVNGPPGTGKTTLLLSIVASLWAKAALHDDEPPVIVAASTNNQAVTNVIDAFGKDFATGIGLFAGRWLPKIWSYGSYFLSRGKENVQEGNYQTGGFFSTIESEQYVRVAQEHYLKSAAAAFPAIEVPTVQLIVDMLRSCIQDEANKLAVIENAWWKLVEARKNVLKELGNNPQDKLAEQQQQAAMLEVRKHINDRLEESWNSYLAQESIFYSLFGWLPPVAKKRLRLARLFVKKLWPEELPWKDWSNVQQIEMTIKAMIDQSDRSLHVLQASIQRGEQVLKVEQVRLVDWTVALALLGVTADNCPSLANAEEYADQTIRFHIFQLATHYWEGRWLLDMQALLPEIEEEKRKNGRKVLEKRWRRRMKLTPCAVSTFYRLPIEMEISRYEERSFARDYLYNFIDLLVVDEASQVLPEVAGASFALAKRALVIGDTLQIEPIWSIPKYVDIGNLISTGLLSETSQYEEAYERLSETGKMAASGSVMRIAQRASRWHYDRTFKERGFFLYEHRRCFDEIIGYCNTLCYHDKLIPKRGSKASASNCADEGADGLPAMGYLHVDGICKRSVGGSRENLLEAGAIAAWLVAKKEELESFYGKPLSEIVGVLTPFIGQVQAIAQACNKMGIAVGGKHGEMTVGTVHSLQGAERPLVIFSAVYTKHKDANGGFIDKTTSMLNVAVSRAQNTFLVFGDMDVFEGVPRDQPRGRLATLLFACESSALQFEYRPRYDLTTSKTKLTQLRDAQEHDEFLKEVLSTSVREVHIVTPWIRFDCIKETGALEQMATAIQRGVKIYVYTDLSSNTNDRDPLVRKNKYIEFQKVVDALRAKKIKTLVVSKVHSKIVISDENIYCVGSFNWFSAVRKATGARHETSLVYRGPDLISEIEGMKNSLRLRLRDILLKIDNVLQ